MTLTQLLVVVVASATGAMVKSVTGMGYPVVTVPFVALVAGVEDAVLIVAIPNLAANLYMVWETRDARHETRDLPRLAIFGSIGAVIGTLALVRLPDEPLMLLLAATILAFVVLFIRDPHLRLSPATTRRWSPVAGFIAGAMQGAIGVSAPAVATWMHGYRLKPRTFIHSVTVIFALTGAIQLAILLAQGQMTVDRAVAMMLATVTVAVIIPLGTRFRDRLKGNTFDRLVLGVILLSAASLVFDVVT